MRILLTGHKGFIGSHVYEHLTRIGYDVAGLDRPDDIGDFADVGCADYDIVIHLAAYAALRDSVKIQINSGRTMLKNHNQYLIIVESIILGCCMQVLLVHMVGGRIPMQ